MAAIPMGRYGEIDEYGRVGCVPALGCRQLYDGCHGAGGRRADQERAVERQLGQLPRLALRITTRAIPSMSVMRKVLLASSTNAWLREQATKAAFVRRSVAAFMAGRAGRGCARGGARAAASGDHHDSHRARREPDQGRRSRRRHPALPRRASTRSRRPGSTRTSRSSRRSWDSIWIGRCASATSIACSNGPISATTSCGSTWSTRRTSIRHSSCSAAPAPRSPRIGIALQAYLYRTANDVESLIPLGPAVRIVKGAYLEPPEIAYPKKSDVDENFYKLCVRLMSPEAQRAGALLHIATHDAPLAERLDTYAREHQVPPVGLRIRDALRHRRESAEAPGRRGQAPARAHQLRRVSGSRGTCAGWPSARRTCGSW